MTTLRLAVWRCPICGYAIQASGKAIEVTCNRHSSHPAPIRGGVRMVLDDEDTGAIDGGGTAA